MTLIGNGDATISTAGDVLWYFEASGTTRDVNSVQWIGDVNHDGIADALAAALAVQCEATLVTGDPEFKPLEQQVRIQWLVE